MKREGQDCTSTDMPSLGIFLFCSKEMDLRTERHDIERSMHKICPSRENYCGFPDN